MIVKEARVKFVSLVVKQPTERRHENDDASNGGVINFKKFRKVPKFAALPLKGKKSRAGNKFTSFKHEDINSQFDIFMNSMRR